MGAEKKNHVDSTPVVCGVNLERQPSWAAVAKAMGVEGQRTENSMMWALHCEPGGCSERGQDDVLEMMVSASWAILSPRRGCLAGAPSREIQADGGQVESAA